MEKIITYEKLRLFAYSNDRLCAGNVKGIAISFGGLGSRDMYAEDTEAGKFFAGKGIIFVIPYLNPWAWMNRQSVAFADEVIDVLAERYGLAEGFPIVSCGGSMGGQSALVYTAYAKRTPVACVANCPVCDLPYHYTEREDLPRTLYSALWHDGDTMREALEAASPLHLVERMPQASYTIFHCDMDEAVNKAAHSDRFVNMMRQSHAIRYYEVPGRGHCDLPDDMRARYNDTIAEAFA